MKYTIYDSRAETDHLFKLQRDNNVAGFIEWYGLDMKEDQCAELQELGVEKFCERHSRAVWDYVADVDQLNWEDAEYQLCAIERQVEGLNYLTIANVGTWRGRRSGYKESESILDAVRMEGCELEIYVEHGALHVIGRHHDGTNYATIYVRRRESSDTSYDALLNDIYDGSGFSNSQLYRNCKSVGKVAMNYFKGA